MRNRIALVAVCAALALFAATFASAQQKKDVQITQPPKVENVTGNSAVIAWSTNTSASTLLKYGTEPNKLDQSAQAPWGGLTHRVTLKNLKPDTTYYYQVTSAQGSGSGTGAISSVQQFKTTGSGTAAASNSGSSQNQSPAGGSPNAQVVVGPIPQKITSDSATIYWETTQPTENIVKYGTSPNSLNQTAQVPYGGTTHRVELSKLQPDTTYYVSIEKPDGSVRSNGQFKTMPANFAQNNPNAVQITNGPNVEYLTPNEAIVAWSTNVPSSSLVKYGTDMNSMNQTAEAPWGGTTHRVTLKNLNPNTKYWFQIQSGQGQGTGTLAATGLYTFQTIQPGQAAMTMKH